MYHLARQNHGSKDQIMRVHPHPLLALCKVVETIASHPDLDRKMYSLDDNERYRKKTTYVLMVPAPSCEFLKPLFNGFQG
jgi:hypothetical protein